MELYFSIIFLIEMNWGKMWKFKNIHVEDYKVLLRSEFD